jgi:hypothetical protein
VNRIKSIFIIFALIRIFFTEQVYAQYDESYISSSIANFNGSQINVVKINRKDGHIRAKYFACKYAGNFVSKDYENWSKNRSIVFYASGSYMNGCGKPERAESPGFLCIDGKLINSRIDQKMDGLLVTYPNGDIIAINLKQDSSNIKESLTGNIYSLNFRKPMDILFFKDWVSAERVDVFQTHLLYYNDQPTVSINGSNTSRERRLLAVCRDEENNEVHFLINLNDTYTLYEATMIAAKYLKQYDDLNTIDFIINLETGCQNIFQVFDSVGNRLLGNGFYGFSNLSQSSSLLVYYYE